MPEELVRAEQLIYVGKEDKALEIITNFEKKKDITQEEQLSSLILKGWMISAFTEKVGEAAYQMSQKLGKLYESVEALVRNAFENLWDSKFDKAKDLIMEAETCLIP